jgi:HAD superfamily hydrolase (TIGR01662 family)
MVRNGEKGVESGHALAYSDRVVPSTILFDLDDTLADRRAGLRRYAHLFHDQFAGEMHPCTREEVHDALLRADDFGSIQQAETLANSCLWRMPPGPDLLHDHWNAHFGSTAVCFPGVPDMLADLDRTAIKLGVITNGNSVMQRSKIEALGIAPLLDVIVVSSEVGIRKPDRRIFSLALEKLRATPEEAWFVGDHPDQDIRGAAAAGLRPFWVQTGAFDAEDVPGTHIESVASLRRYLPSAQ